MSMGWYFTSIRRPDSKNRSRDGIVLNFLSETENIAVPTGKKSVLKSLKRTGKILLETFLHSYLHAMTEDVVYTLFQSLSGAASLCTWLMTPAVLGDG